MSHADPAERRDEVRLSDYAARVVRRWYVVVLCIVAAVGLVVLNQVGGDEKVESKTTVFLGQPFTPLGTQTIPATLFTNGTSATQFVRSDEAINPAAAAADVKPGALRNHTSVTSSSTSTSRTITSSATVTITIRGPWTRDQTSTAARSLADSLIAWANDYQQQKEQMLETQIATDQETLKTLRAVVATATRELRGADGANQAILLQTVSDSGSRIDEISYQLTNNQLMMVAAKTIEAAGYVSEPSTSRVTATSRKSSLIVAAFAGLVLGVILALAWDAVRRREQST